MARKNKPSLETSSDGKAILSKGSARKMTPNATTTPKAPSTPLQSGQQPAHRSKGTTPFTIVGVGASAGGLEAMTELLKHLGVNPGIALVVTQHLDPSHESALPALLGRVTSMAVCEAKNNTSIEPNRVYIIPPNKVMRIAKRRLNVAPRRTEKEVRMPIDHLLESLAEDGADRAIGVILSGNGSDGTRGLLAIKAAGGITFAQDEKSSKYTAMPASAISAGCVDFVLPPAQIARELVGLSGRPAGSPIPILPSTSKAKGEERAFEEVLVLLRQRTGVDFAHYKRPTLERRIHRRMGLQKYETLRNYADHLRNHTPELQELFNDILIHVTGFFRDPSVFSFLKKRVFPRIIRGRGPDDPIRLWVPGCSSGEEVYSIAIALMEFLAEHKAHYTIQIFGTDINMAALDRARMGFYPAGIAADVSVERLRRFFTKLDNGYRIQKSIREMCVFARQNVAVDPPFSNLDLISCRNLLIYLGQPLQRKVFPVFHYALRPTGYLILGASETTGSFGDLFILADKKNKIYNKKPTVTRPAVTFGHPVPESKVEEPLAPAPSLQVGPSIPEIQKQADRLVLTHFSPSGVVINRQMEVLQFRGRTGPYLEHSHGEANLNLLKMAREGLAIDLRATINKAVSKNSRARQDGVRVKTNDHFILVNIEVTPFVVPPAQERFLLVMFHPVSPPEDGAGKKASVRKGRPPWSADTREMHRLREELAATRESLQAIIEEQEATNEELRSANEEIMSSNEELQSTNEELETAKEELQSTNEELTTLNDELENRNTELENVNNDLHNLLVSVNIPIVMVGPDLRIRRFTSVADRLFSIIPTDVGRSITDIRTKIDLPTLDKQISEVIDTLQTKEFEMRCHQGHWWSVRIRPYKTTDSKIDGAVIAFVDIEHQKNSRK
jgi:two-component system CheB/CheR fusion protein